MIYTYDNLLEACLPIEDMIGGPDVACKRRAVRRVLVRKESLSHAATAEGVTWQAVKRWVDETQRRIEMANISRSDGGHSPEFTLITAKSLNLLGMGVHDMVGRRTDQACRARELISHTLRTKLCQPFQVIASQVGVSSHSSTYEAIRRFETRIAKHERWMTARGLMSCGDISDTVWGAVANDECP